jgi:transcriptional regulator with XRE-family HTH domain
MEKSSRKPIFYLTFLSTIRIFDIMKKYPDLRTIRQSRGFSQADLAELLGVTLSYVSHLETGTRKISDDLARRLADSLNVTRKDIRKAAERIAYDNALSKSWLVNMEINGSPLLEAFKYHLLASGPNMDLADQSMVREELMEFVRDNLPYSVMAELTGNDRLLTRIVDECREIIPNL